MKKLLLAGIAVLSVLSASAAHADKLPDTITGNWCYFEGDNPDPDGKMMIYTVHTHKDCPSGAIDGIVITKDRIDGDDGFCTFEKIVRISANAFMIYHQCRDAEDKEDSGGGPRTYEIIDGKLVITFLTEG
jgi:hypothetical protein